MVLLLVTDGGADHMLLEVYSQEGVLLSEDGDQPDARLQVSQEEGQMPFTEDGPKLGFFRII